MLTGKYSASSSSEESLIEKKGEANFLDDDLRVDKEKLKKVNAEYNEHYPDILRSSDDKQNEIEDANLRFNSFYSTNNEKSINGHRTNDEVNNHTSSCESMNDTHMKDSLTKKKKIRFQ